MKKYILTLTLLLASLSISLGQEIGNAFEQGNKHYADGRYQEAIDAYRKVIDSDQESAAVYYNLANAHYKLNNVAPSIYYFEKAKRLDPADAEIRNNIAFAEKMRIDAIQPLPENTFKKWFNNVLNLMTTDGWAYTTVGLVILFVLLFLGLLFQLCDGKKKGLIRNIFYKSTPCRD